MRPGGQAHSPCCLFTGVAIEGPTQPGRAQSELVQLAFADSGALIQSAGRGQPALEYCRSLILNTRADRGAHTGSGQSMG